MRRKYVPSPQLPEGLLGKLLEIIGGLAAVLIVASVILNNRCEKLAYSLWRAYIANLSTITLSKNDGNQ